MSNRELKPHQAQQPQAVLIVPACGKDRGGGHLNRSLFLLEALEESGRESYLWISENQKEDVFHRFRNFIEKSEFSKGFNARLLSDVNEVKKHKWDFIIIDNFKTSKSEFAFWSSLGTVIGVDEGGECRNNFDFLIDLLPALGGAEPNLISPNLLPLPKKRKSSLKGGTEQVKVLIAFGAEDNAKLGPSAAKRLSSFKAGASGSQITLVTPHADTSGLRASLPNVKVSGLVPNLREYLSSFDIFITHFGISAFEAVYAKVPVLLISPGSYHEKLGRKAGFVNYSSVDQIKHNIVSASFIKALEDRRKKIALKFSLDREQKEDLGSFFGSLSIKVSSFCPACGVKLSAESAPVLTRFPEETYRQCPNCKIIYLNRLKNTPIVYNREYFYESYKKQYCKTYIEDFPKLMEMSKKRLENIKRVHIKINEEIEMKSRLFDIGCAYGPFMKAAFNEGYSVFGMDPIDDAVNYVNEELGLTAWQGYFPSGHKAEDGPFDIVSLWYVIEHFLDAGKILKDINKILREGGVLAFSTPSFSGISGRKKLHSFLKNSPSDHWTVWNPKVCKKILKIHGFIVKKIIVTGHHPERFPIIGKLIKTNNRGIMYKILLLVSSIFGLGDTFEVYSVKKTEKQ